MIVSKTHNFAGIRFSIHFEDNIFTRNNWVFHDVNPSTKMILKLRNIFDYERIYIQKNLTTWSTYKDISSVSKFIRKYKI